MSSFGELTERIRSLEAQRTQLNGELEALKKAAQKRAATLEEELAQMREELSEMRQVLDSSSEADNSGLGKEKEVDSPNFEVKLDALQEELASEETNQSAENSSSESTLSKLSEDERKAIGVLQAHNGKYPQRDLRTEAKFSWLQANRVVSHLVEQGLVSVDRSGVLATVTLTEALKK